MSAVVPIDEIQRNTTAFDAEMEFHDDVRECEERVFRAIMRGREDELVGRTRTLDHALQDAVALRNAQCERVGAPPSAC